MATRVGQIADYFQELREENRQQAKTQPAKRKNRMRRLTEAEAALIEHLESDERGRARTVISSEYGAELWPMVEDGRLELTMASRVASAEIENPSRLSLERLLWCWEEPDRKDRQLRCQGAMRYGDAFVELVSRGNLARGGDGSLRGGAGRRQLMVRFGHSPQLERGSVGMGDASTAGSRVQLSNAKGAEGQASGPRDGRAAGLSLTARASRLRRMWRPTNCSTIPTSWPSDGARIAVMFDRTPIGAKRPPWPFWFLPGPDPAKAVPEGGATLSCLNCCSQ